MIRKLSYSVEHNGKTYTQDNETSTDTNLQNTIWEFLKFIYLWIIYSYYNILYLRYKNKDWPLFFKFNTNIPFRKYGLGKFSSQKNPTTLSPRLVRFIVKTLVFVAPSIKNSKIYFFFLNDMVKLI